MDVYSVIFMTKIPQGTLPAAHSWLLTVGCRVTVVKGDFSKCSKIHMLDSIFYRSYHFKTLFCVHRGLKLWL